MQCAVQRPCGKAVAALDCMTAAPWCGMQRVDMITAAPGRRMHHACMTAASVACITRHHLFWEVCVTGFERSVHAAIACHLVGSTAQHSTRCGALEGQVGGTASGRPASASLQATRMQHALIMHRNSSSRSVTSTGPSSFSLAHTQKRCPAPYSSHDLHPISLPPTFRPYFSATLHP